MASTPVLIPVEEYLSTSYRPDRDYVDGEVRERNLGEKPHSKIQAFLIGYFLAHASEWKIDPLPEQRVQISVDRYRVPDLTLIAEGGPDESIIRTPPMLCIEILSREDRMTEILGRVDDYLGMGVAAVWIVDPWRREAYQVDHTGTLSPRTPLLSIPGTPIELLVGDMFACLAPTRNEDERAPAKG